MAKKNSKSKRINFASKDLGDLIGCLFAGKFNILCGCDEQVMANIVMGAQGAVGTLYNFMPRLFHRLLRDGEMEKAREEQIRAQKILRVMLKYGHVLGGNVAAVKPIMSPVGIDLGPPRHPMRPKTVDESLEFQKDLVTIGFKDRDPAIMLS